MTVRPERVNGPCERIADDGRVDHGSRRAGAATASRGRDKERKEGTEEPASHHGLPLMPNPSQRRSCAELADSRACAVLAQGVPPGRDNQSNTGRGGEIRTRDRGESKSSEDAAADLIDIVRSYLK